MSDDQLFGREATEAAQGYTPMPEPVADKPDPELEHAQAIERIIDRDPPSPIVERKYVRADDDSKPQPDNRTVELDRAAEDLAQNRIAEAAIAEIERDLQLANEIDEARRVCGQSAGRHSKPISSQQPQPDRSNKPRQLMALIPKWRPRFETRKFCCPDRHHLENTREGRSRGQRGTAEAIGRSTGNAWACGRTPRSRGGHNSDQNCKGVLRANIPGALQALATAEPTGRAANPASSLTNTQTLMQQASRLHRSSSSGRRSSFSNMPRNRTTLSRGPWPPSIQRQSRRSGKPQ